MLYNMTANYDSRVLRKTFPFFLFFFFLFFLFCFVYYIIIFGGGGAGLGDTLVYSIDNRHFSSVRYIHYFYSKRSNLFC